METEIQEQKRTFGWAVDTFFKTVGFVLWCSLPQTFSMIGIMIPQALAEIPELKGLEMPVAANWILGLADILFSIFSVWWIWNYYKKHTSYKIQKMGLKDIGISVAAVVLLLVISYVGSYLNQLMTGNGSTSNDDAIAAVLTDKGTFPLFIVTINVIVVLVGPILEELVFRGIFLDLWFKDHKKWLPAIISSSIFSLMHGFDNMITFLIYFSMGLTMFFVYYRRHNIKDSILLHILNNLIASLELFFLS